MCDVERCHKVTSRHRTKYSNKKLDETTAAYCEIAIAQSNTRRRERTDGKSVKYTVMDAFRSRMHSAMKARAEREAAAQAIAEARAAVGAEESEEENIHDSMEDILNEACEETGIGFAGFSSDDEDY